MKTNTTIGAIFLGAGFGILLGLLFPGLAWFWPLGLILGGVLLWRRLGTLAATIVVAASLSLALSGSSGPLNLGFPSLGERQLARYEIMGDEARAAMGVTEGLLRINVGLEDIEDLVEDMDRALKAAGI
jgi:hypothetical protein